MRPGLLPPFLRGALLPLFLRGVFWRGEKPGWLYAFMVRRVLWGNTPAALSSYAWIVSLVSVGLTAGGLLLFMQARWELGVWLILAVAGLLFTVVDFAAVAFGIVTAQAHDAQFDLLRMTPIGAGLLVNAMHQTAQTRTWRVLVVMQAMRLAVLALAFTLGISIVVLAVLFTGGVWMLPMLLLVVSEPLWRLEMITALGVMAGIRGHSTAERWGVGLGGMLAVWVAQGMLAVLPLVGLGMIDDAWVGAMIWITVTLTAVTAVIWAGQRLLRDLWLRIAAETLERG